MLTLPKLDSYYLCDDASNKIDIIEGWGDENNKNSKYSLSIGGILFGVTLPATVYSNGAVTKICDVKFKIMMKEPYEKYVPQTITLPKSHVDAIKLILTTINNFAECIDRKILRELYDFYPKIIMNVVDEHISLRVKITKPMTVGHANIVHIIYPGITLEHHVAPGTILVPDDLMESTKKYIVEMVIDRERKDIIQFLKDVKGIAGNDFLCEVINEVGE